MFCFLLKEVLDLLFLCSPRLQLLLVLHEERALLSTCRGRDGRRRSEKRSACLMCVTEVLPGHTLCCRADLYRVMPSLYSPWIPLITSLCCCSTVNAASSRSARCCSKCNDLCCLRHTQNFVLGSLEEDLHHQLSLTQWPVGGAVAPRTHLSELKLELRCCRLMSHCCCRNLSRLSC